jgi:hypothetical protein
VKKKRKLDASIKKRTKVVKKPKTPLWKGPEEDGLTQSLFGAFLVCRERFRLKVVEGLTTASEFNHALEFGQMWHTCEEAVASEEVWLEPLLNYSKTLLKKYPLQREQIGHWYNVCKLQFQLYLEHYSKQKERRKIQPLLQEESFEVPYLLPSGRTVLMRGKWDRVDIVGSGAKKFIRLGEHKTKGQINDQQIERQLSFDLQTMYYLTALDTYTTTKKLPKVRGILYNVVRRPLSGGKGSIRRHKGTKKNPQGESLEAFYGRLGAIIGEAPEEFFYRWDVEISEADITKFKTEFLTPQLESLVDWWEWVSSPEGLADSFANPIHHRHPYGVYNTMNEGRQGDIDEYLATGSTVGLTRAKTLFPEL